MDELPSTEFRRVYASLKAPVVVTVSGHPIGTYVPISTAIDSRHVEAIRPGEPRITVTPQATVGPRPWTPVPKPSQRRK